MAGKASMDILNTLHDRVANQLLKEVEQGDMKAIEKAINFLKNNSITVDLVESKETKDLFTTVKETVDKGKTVKSVEELMAMYAD